MAVSGNVMKAGMEFLAFYVGAWLALALLVAAPFAVSAIRTMRRERQPHNGSVVRCVLASAVDALARTSGRSTK